MSAESFRFSRGFYVEGEAKRFKEPSGKIKLAAEFAGKPFVRHAPVGGAGESYPAGYEPCFPRLGCPEGIPDEFIRIISVQAYLLP
jgi:hypothetical protein